MHDNPYDDFSYRCQTCGEIHVGLPDLAFDAPWHYYGLPEDEREACAVLDSDTCSIRDEDFFIRGCLEIPVHGRKEPFSYGVWESLSREHFRRYVELYEDQRRVTNEPWFAWLCSQLPGYPDTLLLKTNLHLRQYPTRPYIELEPTDHPLAVEQREGISLRRLQEIVELNRHGTHAV